jgi:hypothetical protein
MSSGRKAVAIAGYRPEQLNVEARMRVLLPLTLALALLAPAAAQAQQMRLAQAKPPQQQAPAAKPYTPVAVTLPEPLKDPSFEAFRKQLGEIAQKKDRAALSKLIVAQGFFWEAENGDKADKKKSGFDNLSAAIGLTGKEPYGWELLVGYASDPTAAPYPGKQGVICAPADPTFDDKALEDLAKATQTDPGEWGYPLADGVEVRASNNPKAPVTEKLGLHFVRILPDEDAAAPAPNQIPLIKVVTPSGKTGFVSADAVAPLGNDQICYVKEAGGWKIAGFVGSGEQ